MDTVIYVKEDYQLKFVCFAIILFVIPVLNVHTLELVPQIQKTRDQQQAVAVAVVWGVPMEEEQQSHQQQQEEEEEGKGISSPVFNVVKKLINNVSNVTIIIVPESGWGTLVVFKPIIRKGIVFITL